MPYQDGSGTSPSSCVSVCGDGMPTRLKPMSIQLKRGNATHVLRKGVVSSAGRTECQHMMNGYTSERSGNSDHNPQ